MQQNLKIKKKLKNNKFKKKDLDNLNPKSKLLKKVYLKIITLILKKEDRLLKNFQKVILYIDIKLLYQIL